MRLLCFWAILCTSYSFAQIKPVILAEGREEFCLDSSLVFFTKSDSTGSSEIVKNAFFNSHFLPTENFNYQFGYTTDWKWIAFDIKNTTGIGQYFYLLIHNSMIEDLDFYVKKIESDSLVNKITTGFSKPFETRSVEHRHFIFKQYFPADAHFRIYLRAHLNAGNLLLPMNIYSTEGYMNNISFNNSVVMAITLLWLLGCVFALFFYINFRDVTFLFYFGYIFFLMLFWLAYEGITFEYLWPHSSYLASNSRNFYVPAALCFTAFVLGVVTASGRKLTKLWRVFKIASLVYLPLFVLLMLPGNVFPFLNKIVFLNDVNLVLLIAISIYAISIKIKEGNKVAKWLLMAISPMLVFTLFQLMIFWGVLPISRNNLFVQHGFGICAIIEIVFLYWMITQMLKRIQNKESLVSQRLKLTQIRVAEQKEEPKENASRYEKSKYSEEDIKLLHNRLFDLMQSEKPYLDSELSLNSLAEMLNCKSHMLSQCINQIENSNFSEYVNSLRIQKAKEMLLSMDDKLSVEGIAWEVGFGNKSAFYTAFKKSTGITPKQFKEAGLGNNTGIKP